MDTRDTPEQAELRRSARQLASQLSAGNVADLDDVTRAQRLASAVRDAGWLELRDDGGDGAPVASGVEAAIVADALGGAVADVAFTGPVLARDLARRAGAKIPDGAGVAFGPELDGVIQVGSTTTSVPAFVVDAAGVGTALVLEPDGGLAAFSLDPAEGHSADLTRVVREVQAGTPIVTVDGRDRLLDADALAAWTALGLALTSADLVGVMRGVLDVTVDYAKERQQYGVPVGSFQAVQHLLADAHCLMEGALSVSLHASWAADCLPPVEAVAAGRVAKAYCARAARTVCETAVQVHGGIGNTWECIVHVYLRRALLSSQWFGDDGFQLQDLARDRLGVTDGLP